MSYSANSPHIHWVCPEERGQLDIADLHVPKSLKKEMKRRIKRRAYHIKIDHDFRAVITACAKYETQRPETWINNQIIEAYCKLHQDGHAHSIEYWEGDQLLGGLYGLKIGQAFFGESMFSRTSNASKIALVHLCARLWQGGFQILDTQFVNDHLTQFGVYEIRHQDYVMRLRAFVNRSANFHLSPDINEYNLVMDFFDMQSTLPPKTS